MNRACLFAGAFVLGSLVAATSFAQPSRGPTLTRPPTLLRFVEATHPESERGRAATVVLQLRVNELGRVDEARVTESGGAEFDRAALDAARQFVFTPAEIDGRPAAVRLAYRYQFTIRVEAPTSAEFVGVVRSRNARAPMAGVTVSIEQGESTVTDGHGRFRFERVAPGARVVSLSGPRVVLQRVTERFEAGQRVEATYDVSVTPARAAQRSEDEDDVELVVTAPPVRRQAVTTDVSAEQARRVPGTQGDVLRVVESLPGVARATAGSGALVVWGAAPEDTRVLVDGVPVPRLYHDGGFRSVLSGELVSNVELVPGAYGAAYGRALGGLVRVETRSLEDRGVHGALSVDAFDASASMRASIGERARVFAAVRRSHLWQLLAAAGIDAGGFVPIPRYGDAQLRVGWTLSPRERIDLTVLLSTDFTERSVRVADPSRDQSERRTLDVLRVYGRYTRRGDGLEVSIVPYAGVDAAGSRAQTSGAATGVDNVTLRAGVRASLRARVRPWLSVEAGIDAELSRSDLAREGSVALPAREGDVRVFGQPPPDQSNADRWSVWQAGVAPYAEATISLASGAVELTPGLRVDPYVRSASRRLPPEGISPSIGLFTQDFRVEPRLAARFRPHPRVTIRAAFGAVGQLPAPEDLSAVFGAPTLQSPRGTQWAVGAAWAINDTLTAEATGFFTESSQLAMRSELAAPLRAEALVARGEGRAYGVQVLLRQALVRNFFGWITYSLSRSERKNSPESAWRSFDFDQTHVLGLVASYTLPLGFELGARARLSSGFVRTPVVGSYFDARRDRYEPLFGAQNSDRLPVFFQLDLRASKRFRIGVSELELSVDVQNVTAQRNAEEFVYDESFGRREVIAGLPILPSVGARWTF